MATEEGSPSNPQPEIATDNKTRDALTEGLIGLLSPAIEEVDERVTAVR